MIDEIANEIVIASQLLSTNNVSRIAEEIGYRPLLIINALYRASETGKFTFDKKKDTLTLAEDLDVEHLVVSEGMRELIEQLDMFIGYLNSEEKDMTIEELMMMLGGTPDLHIKIAAFASDKLTTYQLFDPKDKKSVYTFVTLKENAEKLWGQKQFNQAESKATKAAKKNARKAAKQAEEVK